MDPVARREFWKIIKELKKEGKTIVLTTQFLDEAEELADRVAIISKGILTVFVISINIQENYLLWEVQIL